MIIFKRLKYKNFLSTGNHPIELKLDKDPRTIIIGSNGQGKSTIISALTFGLFGKDYRGINKPLLVNSINRRGLEVEVEFETRGKNYIIKRGINPNIFEVYMDGNLVNQTAFARDYQEYIEENVLKINFNSFKQIVVLGANKFTPFMRLTASARRSIIEDLLGITVFSKMNVVLKTNMANTKEGIQVYENKIQLSLEKKEIVQNHINQIKNSQDKKKQDLLEEITKYEGIVSDADEKLLKLNEEDKSINEKISAINTILERKRDLEIKKSACEKELKDVQKKIDFLNHHSECPTCRQNMSEEYKSAEFAALNTIKDGKEKELEEIVPTLDKMGELSQKLLKLNAKKTIVSKSMGDLRQEKSVSKKYLDKLGKDVNAIVTDSEFNMSDLEADNQKHLEDIINFNMEKDKLIASREIEGVAFNLLKDSGIKTKIIKSYIPYINSLINDYLMSMDFFVNFELDENFNETIKSRHRDTFSYENFSEGEKQRIDLAILFAWRQLAKKKNSMATNLLFLDETFDSSMDSVGVEDITKILYTLKDTNVFLISHRENMADKFDKIIKMEKVDKFSVMKEL